MARARLPLPEGEALPPVEDTTPMGLDRRFLTSLHGKVFVRYAGLLALAHARGGGDRKSADAQNQRLKVCL